MTVKIEIYGEDAGHALRELMGLSTGLRTPAKVEEVIAASPLSAPVASDMSADVPERAAEEQPAPKPRGRPRKDAAPVPVPAPEPGVEAQDAADEAEESAAEAPAAEKNVEVFTRDSIRKELGNYSTAYGMEHALTDGPLIIEAKNASAVDDTQEALGKAVMALRGAIVANPYKRARASGGAA